MLAAWRATETCIFATASAAGSAGPQWRAAGLGRGACIGDEGASAGGAAAVEAAGQIDDVAQAEARVRLGMRLLSGHSQHKLWTARKIQPKLLVTWATLQECSDVCNLLEHSIYFLVTMPVLWDRSIPSAGVPQRAAAAETLRSAPSRHCHPRPQASGSACGQRRLDCQQRQRPSGSRSG